MLTKRPERILQCLPADWGDGYTNVWIGVSVENQKNCHRLDVLNRIPSKTKFASFEPLLEEIQLSEEQIKSLDWIIIGGESGEIERLKSILRKIFSL